VAEFALEGVDSPDGDKRQTQGGWDRRPFAGWGGVRKGWAAKKATATIPIVFTNGFDPIQIGLVASFNRPEGNVTVVYTFSHDLPTKSLELLHELVPAAAGNGLLINPTEPNLSETGRSEGGGGGSATARQSNPRRGGQHRCRD
jgi:hypothetical protein